ncbi:hypothetical protein [Parachitinimonas caeni]|uniref:Delta-60 repeat protein n=1 Tax=Parachitinimonas caeni TaxID=3031301 RepID=A0ABT7DW88_9NEIS|nr:hypothetical protein [Parachitinimonas caeni]MDK2124104.1 hypothetical protein [Parachitinimonas caeni]
MEFRHPSPLRLSHLALATLTALALTACNSGDSGNSNEQTAHKSGSLDPSFGEKGKLIEQVGQPTNYAVASRQLADGKVMLLHSVADGSPRMIQVLLSRLLPNGQRDDSFGNQGSVVVSELNSLDGIGIYAAAIQPDGQLVFAIQEQRVRGPRPPLRLIRIGLDGKRDTSFGNQGELTIETVAFVKSMTVDEAGNIVGAGWSTRVAGSASAVFRVNRYGKLDTGFGQGGTAVIMANRTSHLQTDSLSIDSQGRILVAAMTEVASDTSAQLVVSRLNRDGSPDTSLNNSGELVQSQTGGHSHSSLAMTPEANGGFAVAYNRREKIRDPINVLRFRDDGSLAAIIETPLSTPSNGIGDRIGLVPTSDGRLLLANNSPSNQQNEVALVRLGRGGTSGDYGRDFSFGKDGVLQTGITGVSFGTSLDLSRTSNGIQLFASGNKSELTALSFDSLGNPDSRFGKSGVSELNFGLGSVPQQTAMAANNANRLFVATTAASRTSLLMLDANGRRASLPSGTPNPSNTTGIDLLQDMTALPDGGIGLMGTRCQLSDDCSLPVVTRLDADGRRVSRFGNEGEVSLKGDAIAAMPDNGLVVSHFSGYTRLNAEGKVQYQVGSDNQWLTGAPLYLTGKLTSAQDGSFDALAWRYDVVGIIRHLPDGKLDERLGNKGVASLPLGGAQRLDRWTQLRQSNGKLLLAGVIKYSDDDQRLRIYRLTADGKPDTSYGSNGMLETPQRSHPVNFDNSSRTPQLAQQEDGKLYVLARSSENGSSHTRLLRYTADGQVDSSFGNQGEAVLNLGDTEVPLSLTMQSGRPVVSSQITLKGFNRLAIARVLP